MRLFGASVILLLLLTLSESVLTGMSIGMERLVTFLLLVLPAGAGSALGVLGLTRRQGPLWLAWAGTILNGLFALFHMMIVLFAG
jgi:hypothetical protein